ncbi:hypothetical protein HCG49_16645 [Arenibacter sp. 6A1]|uniref:hypothetical protein n=1 Tax=Arenibacter sp. 6A1 TaxID=2720391 RepID=UPI001446E0E0|nr:hypothetical protein [Arenibacter sp. 6A1]NKI28185.1 hypothetical protein [Arenibacter sp. 6A1]
MSKKLYSLEHISKVYNTDVENLKIWTAEKFNDKSLTELPPSVNNEIATFLGVQPLSLKSKKKRKNSSSKRNEYLTELKQIKEASYKEKILDFVTDLKQKVNDERIIQTIDSIYNSLPNKKEYILENCEKKYFTWKDIIFTEKGVKINPNILYLSINIDGPTKILNEISNSYFQKKFSKELYKVYLNKFNEKVEFTLSDDIQKIKNIVSEHINNSKKEKKISTITLEKPRNNSRVNLNQDKEINIKDIATIFQSNKFIQQASKLIKNDNKAVALWENNNSTSEEALIIILKHKVYNFVIWENINENRACYIFKYENGNFNRKIKALKTFIMTDIEYKRWDLFNNNGNHNQLNYEEYYTVIHESIDSYKRKLNSYLKPYFKIK